MSAVEHSPATPFRVTVVPNRDEIGVLAVGELDFATAPALAREIDDLQAAGFRRLVVDLHEVEFIDSTGLRMLLDLHDELDRQGGRLTLVPPRPGARRIFEITATRHLFDWRDRFTA
jgi:anti-anti-sigma factor